MHYPHLSSHPHLQICFPFSERDPHPCYPSQKPGSHPEPLLSLTSHSQLVPKPCDEHPELSSGSLLYSSPAGPPTEFSPHPLCRSLKWPLKLSHSLSCGLLPIHVHPTIKDFVRNAGYVPALLEVCQSFPNLLEDQAHGMVYNACDHLLSQTLSVPMWQPHHMPTTVLYTPLPLHAPWRDALIYLRTSYSPLRPVPGELPAMLSPPLWPSRVTVSLPCAPINPKGYVNTCNRSYYVCSTCYMAGITLRTLLLELVLMIWWGNPTFIPILQM